MNSGDAVGPPRHVGILAAELYVPQQCVMQDALETHDGAARGKYTEGLGQVALAVPAEWEDTPSMCMTAAARLLQRLEVNASDSTIMESNGNADVMQGDSVSFTGTKDTAFKHVSISIQRPNRPVVALADIGRIEVGSESNPDRSKSIKSCIMQLFAGSGCPEAPEFDDIGGVDSVNACYGGTAALLNAVHWIESADWDGRYALVVVGDIAVYGTETACKCKSRDPNVIHRSASLVCALTENMSDHQSGDRDDLQLECSGLDYDRDISRQPSCSACTGASPSARATGGAGAVALLIGPDAPLPLERGGTIAHCMSHVHDFYKPGGLHFPIVHGAQSVQTYLSALERCYLRHRGRISPNSSLMSFDHWVFHAPYAKLVRKAFARLICTEKTVGNEILDETTLFDERVAASQTIPRLVGNAYCASVFAGLISLLVYGSVRPGQRIGVFSYGSGMASSMYSILPRRSSTWGEPKDTVDAHAAIDMLQARRIVSPAEYVAAIDRHDRHSHGANLRPAPPKGVHSVFALDRIDACRRRMYTWHE